MKLFAHNLLPLLGVMVAKDDIFISNWINNKPDVITNLLFNLLWIPGSQPPSEKGPPVVSPWVFVKQESPGKLPAIKEELGADVVSIDVLMLPIKL